MRLLRTRAAVLKLQTRHHAQGREELDDVGLLGGHREFVGHLTEHEADETVRAVRRPAPHAVVAADGKFDLVAHGGTLHFPLLCSSPVTRQTGTVPVKTNETR